MENNTKSILFSLSAVFLWSTVAAAFKLTLEGITFAQLLFYSSSASCVVLFIFVIFNEPNKFPQMFGKKYLAKNILMGAANPFLYYLVLFKAYSILPAQEAQPLNYTWPITISIFSVIFLNQKLCSRTIIGLISAFIGVVIIATRGDFYALKFHNLYGVILAVGSSIIWALYWIMNLLDKRSNSIKLFSAFFYGSIISAVYVFFFDSFFIAQTEYLAGAVYIGLFEMGITFFLWLKGLELSSNKSKTSTLAYMSPFVSLIFISTILNEKLFTSSILGLLFIIGGILLQQIRFKRE